MPIEDLNKIGLRNTRATYDLEPASRDPYVNGTKAVEASHTSEKKADPKYEHWCRPEPRREFPFKSSTAEAYREKQAGLQDDTPGLKRAESGGVIGSQQGVIPPKGSPHFQTTNWGEYNEMNQWDKEQEHTYPRSEQNEPFDD
jgi:hypothetical protein